MRRRCGGRPGREKLGDGTVGAFARVTWEGGAHTARLCERLALVSSRRRIDACEPWARGNAACAGESHARCGRGFRSPFPVPRSSFPIRRTVLRDRTSKTFAPCMPSRCGEGLGSVSALRERRDRYDAAGFASCCGPHAYSTPKGPLSRRFDASDLSSRRPPATRLLGHYRGRTSTGKSNTTSRTHHHDSL